MRILGSQVGRFLLGGTVTAVVDVGSLVTLAALGVPIPIATTAGFLLAIAVNFTLMRALLGGESRLAVHHQFGRYLVLLGINYGITMALVTAADVWLDRYLLGKGVAVALTAVVSFWSYRTWVFPRPQVDESQQLGERA